MNPLLRRVVVALVVLGMLALPASAGAKAPTAGDAPQLVYTYDDTSQMLVFGFFAPADIPEDFDCTAAPEDDGTTEPAEDGTTEPAEDDTLQPADGCTPVSVAGPNGRVTHGTVISAVVHSMREGFEGTMPFGWYVRQFAKSVLGKKGSEPIDASSQDGESGNPTDRPGNSGNAPGHQSDPPGNHFGHGGNDN
jgi:hypothetical protein